MIVGLPVPDGGDLLLCPGAGFLGVLIGIGSFLSCCWATLVHRAPWPKKFAGRKPWGWAHIAVVVENGGTIEAQAKGVVRAFVADHPKAVILTCPEGVDRAKVINYAGLRVGVPYGYWDFILLAVDALFGTAFRDSTHKAAICSELGADCWVHGGWAGLGVPIALIKPSDFAIWAQGHEG